VCTCRCKEKRFTYVERFDHQQTTENFHRYAALVDKEQAFG